MPEANLLAASALVGRHSQARSLIPTVELRLPTPGRRNLQGWFIALEGLVSGVSLLGDVQRCANLYPLTLVDIQTGVRVGSLGVGPINPQLAAAIAADVAGLTDKAREHFEIASGEAREIPIRLLQPAVLFWQGRSLARSQATGERERGLAMVQAALDEFRTLGLAPHARLAERLLRDGK
ncbi:MAG: hypothetical protein ACT4QD_11925 [Acidobacteriota bacterium]